MSALGTHHKTISFHSCQNTITIKAYQAFSNYLQNRYSKLKLFLLNINVQKEIGVNAYVGTYSAILSL